MQDYSRIDFETHFYPRQYLESLKKRSEFPRFVEDPEIGLVLEYDPKIKIPRQKLLAKFSDAEQRLDDMKSAGIEMQVLSIPLPGVDKLAPDLAVKFCRIANDGLAEVCEKNRPKFVGLAMLPIQAGEAASDELRRSVKDLGLKGGYLHSNSLGHYLDSEEYLSSMRTANALGVPMFVHPTTPKLYPGMDEFRLATTFGLQVDLSLSLLRLIFSSGLESMPGLKLVVSHLGSTLPFISNRIDDEFAYAKSPDTKISRKPSEYMRRLYVDTVTMDSSPLEFAKNYFGANHIVFGSDYPFWDTGLHVKVIENSSLSKEEKGQIFSGTASELLKL